MTTRSKNILILALMIAPFLLSFLWVRLFVDLDEMDKVNKGHLIIPHVDFMDLKPRQVEGAAFTRDRLSGQWTLLYIANGDCDTACKNGLYYLMSQLQKSLKDDAPRVRRLIAHTRDPGPLLRDFLASEVPGMHEIHVDSVAVEHALVPSMEGTNSATDHIFIVSPDGMVFLWYPTHEAMEQILMEAENIRADLTRTLKGSLVG